MLKTITSALSSASFASLLLTSVILYLITWTIYTRRFHPLAKYPGPFWASITRAWLVIDVAKGSAEKTQKRLHRIYGPIVRIAPNEVAIADPDAIKTIYAINSGFTKTDFYLPFRQPWVRYPDSFSETNEQQHSERRRIVNPLYSMSNIVQQEKRIDSCTDMLVEQFTKYAAMGRTVDMAQWAQWYAFDVIGELFFSRMFGFLRHAHDHKGYVHAVDLFMPLIVIASAMPTYLRPVFLISGALIPRIFKALEAFKHLEVAVEACIAAERKIVKAESETGQRKNMLESLYAIVREKGEEKDFGVTEVKMEVFAGFGAGSDTTAAAITSILYHLMRTPSAYAKLTSEIDAAQQSGHLSPTIKYNEAINLPYLAACCKEGMRLHPSVGFTLPRHVPKGGYTIAGEWFPAGTRVGVNAAVVHLDRNIFGHDAEEFVPERWFRDDAAVMERYMFQFGAGSRTCLGKNISLCEIYKVVPTLLRSFHLELENPEKEWETVNYWFNKPAKVYTVLRRREVDDL